MIEIIVFGGICIAVGGVAGWKLREAMAKRIVAQYMKQTEAAFEQNIVNVSITQEGDQYLVHDTKTGEFLAQGDSQQSITDALSQRYPTKTFVAMKDNLRSVGFATDDTV